MHQLVVGSSQVTCLVCLKFFCLCDWDLQAAGRTWEVYLCPIGSVKSLVTKFGYNFLTKDIIAQFSQSEEIAVDFFSSKSNLSVIYLEFFFLSSPSHPCSGWAGHPG